VTGFHLVGAAGFSDSKTVAPALDKYAQGTVAGLWKRLDMKPRDWSIVTLAAPDRA
jgi:hypothetical protein